MIEEALSFDDVMLVPQYSEIDTRSKVDTSIKIREFEFKHPIVPSNMKTVIGLEMATEIIKSGGLAVLHRFMPIDDQVDMAKTLIKLNDAQKYLAMSIGVKAEDKKNVEMFDEIGVRIICIDIAHGDSKHCVEMTSWIRKHYPHMLIIAGNVATGEGAKRLWKAGADVVKTGVGNGSICLTRINTGNGIPQITALMQVKQAKDELQKEYSDQNYFYRRLYIMSDGGCKNSGDITKALCFADLVMVGNLFARCQETPGLRLDIDGVHYKEYAGSSTHKTNHIEGVAGLVPCNDNYNNVLTKLLEGLKSGCSYQGVDNLIDLKESPQFVKISSSGLHESQAHDILLR